MKGENVAEHENENPETALSLLEQKAALAAKDTKRFWLAGIGACLAISLAASSAVLFAYDHWFAQKIVAVDMKGFITLQRYKYKDGKINDEDLRKAFDRLEQMMNGIPKNRVVIMADTAIRNVEVYKLGHEEELKQYDELLRRSLQGNQPPAEQ